MAQVFPAGSQTAYSRYTQSLSDAIKNRDWVYDPSYALQSDWEVYSKILRDPVAAHAIRFRKHLVAGSKVRVVPASEDPMDEAAASLCEDLLKQVCGFTDSRICLSAAIFRGSAYAMITGRRKLLSAGATVDGVKPTPQHWWVPERITDIDRRRFRLIRDPKTKEMLWQLWSVERRDWERLEHPEWFIRSVYDATEASLGYGRGLLDTLYYFQSTKARALQESVSAAERFGQGLVTVGIDNLRAADGRAVGGDQRASEKVAQGWQDAINKAKARHVITHDSRDTIEVVTGNEKGWQLLQWLIGYLDNAQVTAVLGSTLPTLEGDGGSRALGEVQENSTEALVQADRDRLGDDLTRDLLGLVWRHNRQLIMQQVGPATMPSLAIDQQKRQDPEVAADMISKVLAAGVSLRAKDVYEALNFTAPLPGDDVIGGAAPAGAPVESGSPTEPLSAFDPFGAPPPVDLFGMPDPMAGGMAAPVDTGEAPQVADVSLNGAQVSSLLEITNQVSAGLLPLQTALALVSAAFPSISPEVAQQIMVPAANAPAPMPDQGGGMGGPPGAGGPPSAPAGAPPSTPAPEASPDFSAFGPPVNGDPFSAFRARL